MVHRVCWTELTDSSFHGASCVCGTDLPDNSSYDASCLLDGTDWQ